MDARRFDSLVRSLVALRTRRGTLTTLLGGALALRFLPDASAPAPAAAKAKDRSRRRDRNDGGTVTVEGPCGNGSPKANKCKRHRQCCTGFCKNKKKRGRCRCRKQGQTCRDDRSCCASSGQPLNCLDGVCRSCDVCPSGCAFTLVQDAIDAANDGTTVRICPGTYPGDVTIDKPLTVIGAGAGDDPATATILEGTGSASVVTIEGVGVEATLQELRITGGGGGGQIFGAGIVNDAGTLTLVASTVTGNTANDGTGGGIFNGGTLTLTDSTVSENTATFGGGGIRNFGTLTLTNSTITGNTAGEAGGGIGNNGTLTLTGSTVSGNTAITFNGGGIFNEGTATLDATSRVTGNTAPDGQGGGIFSEVATVTLASTEIVTDNTGGNCAPPDTIPNCIEE